MSVLRDAARATISITIDVLQDIACSSKLQYCKIEYNDMQKYAKLDLDCLLEYILQCSNTNRLSFWTREVKNK